MKQSMSLCNVCQKVDVRALLLKSVQTRSHQGWHRPIKKAFQHHQSVVALRTSAQGGCSLCSVIWQSCLNGSEFRNEDRTTADLILSTDYKGPIFLGTDGWWEGPHNTTLITVSLAKLRTRLINDDEFPHCICKLEVYVLRAQVPVDRQEILNLLLREVHTDSRSPTCLDVCGKWLKTCKVKHPRCSRLSKDQNRLPTRLIDVGDDSRDPRLFVTEELGVATGQWAALSYCWGGDSDFMLTKDTYSKLCRGCPLIDFPATLLDAVKISRALGLNYLWVDALCIYQDSKEDWMREAAKMSEIYKDAVVTIAATNSLSATAGILGPRVHSLTCGLPWRLHKSERDNGDGGEGTSSTGLEESIEPKVYLRCREEWKDVELSIDTSRWAKRGWTMQESLLASRTLSFTKGQVIWECATNKVREDGLVNQQNTEEKAGSRSSTLTLFQDVKRVFLKNSSPSCHEGNPHQTITTRDPYELWYHIVTLYSQRSLTKTTDTLPAISSLARYVQVLNGDRYCAGLWEREMKSGLLWYSHEGAEITTSDYIAPSWSWASLSTSLVNFPSRQDEAKPLFLVKEINIELRNPSDLFGQVTSGRLTIQAPFYRLNTIQDDEIAQAAEGHARAFQHFVYLFFKNNYCGGTHEYLRQHKEHPGQHFAALQMLARSSKTGWPSMELLFLESAEDSAAAGPNGGTTIVYRRIGQVALRKAKTPNSVRADALPGQFSIGMAEAAAWNEVAKQRWRKQIVTII